MINQRKDTQSLHLLFTMLIELLNFLEQKEDSPSSPRCLYYCLLSGYQYVLTFLQELEWWDDPFWNKTLELLSVCQCYKAYAITFIVRQDYCVSSCRANTWADNPSCSTHTWSLLTWLSAQLGHTQVSICDTVSQFLRFFSTWPELCPDRQPVNLRNYLMYFDFGRSPVLLFC